MTPFSKLIDMYKNSWNAALLHAVTLSYYIAPTLITSVSGHSILHRDNFYLFTPELAPSIIFVQVGPPFLFLVGVHENNKHI